MIFPYDNVDMVAQIDTLCKHKHTGKPFIQMYDIDGQSYLQIVRWNEHQKPHHTEAESKIPPAPPLKGIEKGSIEVKIKGKQDEASTKLSNVHKTVRQPLKSTELYKCNHFQQFWALYPKKEGKGKAWEEWLKILPPPSEKMVTQAQKVIDILKTTDQWQKEGGQFIPLPSTFLHQRRWEDEPSGKQNAQKKAPQFLSEKGQRTLDNVKDVKFGGEGADD